MLLKRTPARVLASLVVLIALASATPAAASHTRLQDLRRQERATRARLATALVKDREVRAVLARVTARLRAEQSQLAFARAALTRIELRMRAEQRRLQRLDEQRTRRSRIVSARAATLYMMGPISGQGAVTAGVDLGDVVERAASLEFVMSFDKTILEDLATIEDQTKKTKEALRVKRRQAAKVESAVQERVEAVAELVATQQAAHQKLSGSISAYRSELAALDREQGRVTSLIQTRTFSVSTGGGGSVSTGGSSSLGFSWPIRGRITSGYGSRWGGFHTGIDIDCRTGDGVGASKAGKVIASEYMGGYGQTVIIDHGSGYSTLYAHMSRLYVGRGANVTKHQRIGACGSTGNSTGDHLHFEVRVNGQHRNPMNYLP